MVFRPMDVDSGQAHTFGFLDHRCPSAELKLWADFRCGASFPPCPVLGWSQNEPGSKLFFKLYASYVYMQTVLVIHSSHVLASGCETELTNAEPLPQGKHRVRFL